MIMALRKKTQKIRQCSENSFCLCGFFIFHDICMKSQNSLYYFIHSFCNVLLLANNSRKCCKKCRYRARQNSKLLEMKNEKKWHGFSFSINIANEAFPQTKKLTSKLFFLKSGSSNPRQKLFRLHTYIVQLHLLTLLYQNLKLSK